MSGKLDQIIKDLLSKIPVIGDRFKNDEEYEDDETQVDAEYGEEEEEEDEDEDEDEDEEVEADGGDEAKKKKKQLIIRGVIALVGVYLAVDSFVLPMLSDSDSESSSSPEVKTAPDSKVEALRAKRKAQKEAAAKAKADEEAAEKAKAEKEAAAKAKADEEAAEKAKAEKEAAEKAKAKDAAASIAKKEKADSDSKDNAQEDELSDSDNSDLDNAIDEAEQSIDSSNFGEVTEKQSDNKGSSVPKESEYTPAPDYEDYGRGLVYNCKGKYWACIDRKSYFQCRKNERWQAQNNLDLECHVAQTYATDEDCKTVQVYNINMNIPTDFCKGSK